MASIFCILPPYLLRKIAENGTAEQRDAARATLATDTAVRHAREILAASLPPRTPASEPGKPHRTISDCRHSQTTASAKVVRLEGSTNSGDAETDEAYDGLGATYDLYWQAFERNSIDGKGLALDAFVHYGQRYDNAFWDGTEMIFGDGDGTTFDRFTRSVDVIGHELTHGVTQYESNLKYSGQSGALNESVSDVFGSLVKQHSLAQSAAKADWLIGAHLLRDKHDFALRSMKAPGTAYNDPVLGRDPQPATMDGYIDSDDDDGGVHLNSGIPNHAFYLAAIAIGGNAWEDAGKIWYQTLIDNSLESTTDFAAFASATIAASTSQFGKAHKNTLAVHDAWQQVGVIK